MALIDDIIAKCGEVQKQAEFLKTLAGKAKDPEWIIVDPGLTMLRAMGSVQADVILVKAQELKALIP